MADLFWHSDAQCAVFEAFMPRNQPGPEREDDRRIISGIPHVLTSGCRWRDCPDDCGPRTTVYNRFNRWSRRGFWKAMLSALAKAGWVGEAAAIDATCVKAHRSAQGGKAATAQAIADVTMAGPLMDAAGRVRCLIADKGYDADWLRADLRKKGITPVMPSTRARKRRIHHDKRRYRERWRIEPLWVPRGALGSSRRRARFSPDWPAMNPHMR